MFIPTHPHLHWPELDWKSWKDTAETLHLWTQIIGKTRLALTPLSNHWWNVPLYVSACGLTTSAIPYNGEVLDIEFDFLSHALHIRISSGTALSLPLKAQSVASFFAEYKHALATLGISVAIYPVPSEIPAPIPFHQDEVHHSYDPHYAHQFWRVLCSATSIFTQFNSGFTGKHSPVHFFWGSFDLAVTRFSGKAAPPRPDADPITAEAYSHEVISAGFWPGNGGFGSAAFYCYAAPAPLHLGLQKPHPNTAYYDTNLSEFILKYNDLCATPNPDDTLMDFLQSTYSAAATLSHWDRSRLERAS